MPKKSKMPKKRVKWKEEEVDALIRGVEKYKEGDWVEILNDPEFTHHLALRNNQQLKDKWRNLKKHVPSDAGSSEPAEEGNKKIEEGDAQEKQSLVSELEAAQKKHAPSDAGSFELFEEGNKKIEEGDAQEKQRLVFELEAALKKCNDMDIELKKKTEELNKRNSDLEERIAKGESDKLEADNRYREEKEARNAA